MFILGVFWHPSFHLIGAFFVLVSIATIILILAGKPSSKAARAEERLHYGAPS
jgi:hypothetical protein